MKRRKRLSRAERDRMLLEQNGTCCVAGCKESDGLIEEHSTPFTMTGRKADQLMCKAHHDLKTFGKPHVKADGDLSKIAKTKRIANGKTQFDKRKAAGGTRIKSPGFVTWLKKKFTGEVVKR